MDAFVPAAVDIQAFTHKGLGTMLAQLWTAAEGEYTATAKREFRLLRELRAVFIGHSAALRAGFLRYLRRPDQQQALATAFQGTHVVLLGPTVYATVRYIPAPSLCWCLPCHSVPPAPCPLLAGWLAVACG